MTWIMPISFEGSGRLMHFRVKGRYYVSYEAQTRFWSCDCYAGTMQISKGKNASCKHVISVRQAFGKLVKEWEKLEKATN